jgi:PBP1b-binding outer membrane lipoprotein LpoB
MHLSKFAGIMLAALLATGCAHQTLPDPRVEVAHAPAELMTPAQPLKPIQEPK